MPRVARGEVATDAVQPERLTVGTTARSHVLQELRRGLVVVAALERTEGLVVRDQIANDIPSPEDLKNVCRWALPKNKVQPGSGMFSQVHDFFDFFLRKQTNLWRLRSELRIGSLRIKN